MNRMDVPCVSRISLQELQHLRLNRHIERCRRLVRNQELGLQGKTHRDHRALLHAAGKVVRKVADALFRLSNMDGRQESDRLRDGRAQARLPV